MKIGDLVQYNEHLESGATYRGIIVAGPKRVDTIVGPPIQWEVVWYAAPTRGWWNEEFLEVINENW